MNAAVRIQDLSVTLDGGVIALRDIAIELPAGKIVGLIGPSGAGKTTLIRAIVGRLQVKKGTIAIFDVPAGAPELRNRVGYMTQELSVYGDLTVRQNIVYFATMSGVPRKRIKKQVADTLTLVDLSDKANVLVASLSGGQKQRVSLAIALVAAPQLMALDEPTVGLDPVLRKKLWRLFAELAARGTTLVVSSHSMDEAEHCDDLVLLRDGQVIAHDPPETLMQQTNATSIEESFLKLIGDTS